MITLSEIRKSYQAGNQQLDVLKGVDLEIDKGELISLMGTSGSGKSSLLNILGLLDTEYGGEFEFLGKSMRGISQNEAAKIRNDQIGFVFQSFHLIGHMNLVENIALPLKYQGMRLKERVRRAKDILERVDLLTHAHHLPNELSGGQKQRVAVARALITDPDVILADEPTGALDTVTSVEIMNLFREIHASNKTILIVTHDQSVADQCEKIIRISDGKII
jgi:putative ABC transport system ATP-binding protein